MTECKYANKVSEELIYGALRDLVPFFLFIKLEKHSWRSVTFKDPPSVFFLIVHTNDTKLRKVSRIRNNICVAQKNFAFVHIQ